MSLKSLLRPVVRRLRGSAPPPEVPAAPVPAAPDQAVTPAAPALDKAWLVANFGALDYLGPAELDLMASRFLQLAGEDGRLDGAKAIVDFFSWHPEKMRLLASSNYYLMRQPSAAAALAFIAANYAIGESRRAVGPAERLAAEWVNAFTAILHARVAEDARGPEAEHRILAAAAARYPGDMTVRLNLIENLIGTNRVEDANRAIGEIRSFVEPILADEITIAARNQRALEAAIAEGKRFPEGDDDIYTDEMCRNYWVSYYESFVTRREHQHGDRLLLNHFVEWVRKVGREVDVMLDFGTLCAQPLYEAALAAPHIHFIGTDRQQFIADLNAEAYPLPNLSFDHGDIFDVMERAAARPGRKAFVHIRTTCTLYPKFVEEVYAAAARLGFEHIYLIENAGMVRTRLAFVPFETMAEPALVTKHRLHVHNYRQALATAGYEVREWRRNRAPGLWRGDHPATFLGSQYELHAHLTSR
jgi:hypothetical protein